MKKKTIVGAFALAMTLGLGSFFLVQPQPAEAFNCERACGRVHDNCLANGGSAEFCQSQEELCLNGCQW